MAALPRTYGIAGLGFDQDPPESDRYGDHRGQRRASTAGDGYQVGPANSLGIAGDNSVGGYLAGEANGPGRHGNPDVRHGGSADRQYVTLA